MKRVLVVDDNSDILEIVGEILSYEKFEVKSVSEGTGLIKLAENYLPDLILPDYRLPEGNGGELCRQIKSNAKLRHIPVVIFTAHLTNQINFQ